MTEQPEGIEQSAEGIEPQPPQAAEVTEPPVISNPAPTGDAWADSSTYVYAIGRAAPVFPSLDVEMEFRQAAARFAQETERTGGTESLNERELIQSVIQDPANRYLRRLVCYVLSIENLETYILRLSDPVDLDLLVDAAVDAERSATGPADIDFVVGERGPIASPELCNGRLLHLVYVQHIWSFNRDSFIQSIPMPESSEHVRDEGRFRSAAGELYDWIVRKPDNAGATDEDRALNFLAVRSKEVYWRHAEMQGRNFSLSGVEARPTRLRPTGRIVDVIFSYTHRETRFTEKYVARVNVTGMWPFLEGEEPLSPLSPYSER